MTFWQSHCPWKWVSCICAPGIWTERLKTGPGWSVYGILHGREFKQIWLKLVGDRHQLCFCSWNSPACAWHHLLRYFLILPPFFFNCSVLYSSKIAELECERWPWQWWRELIANPEDWTHPSVTAEAGSALYSQLDAFPPLFYVVCVNKHCSIFVLLFLTVHISHLGQSSLSSTLLAVSNL